MLDNINQTQELDGSTLGDKVNDPDLLALKKYES